MSSMFKKKGGLGFKPKLPQARPRAPGAPSSQPSTAPSSSTATQPVAEAEPSIASNDTATQPIVDRNAGAEQPARAEATTTPPSTDLNAGQGTTVQPQPLVGGPTSSAALVANKEVTTGNAVRLGETSTTNTIPTLTSATPTTNAPQTTSSASGPGGAQPNESSTPLQLQTPPATAPTAVDNAPSAENQTDSAAELAPRANNATNAPAKRARKRPAQSGEEAEGDESAVAPKPKRQRKKKDANATEEGGEGPKRQPRPRKRQTAEDGSASAEGTENGTSSADRPKRVPLRRARSVTPEDAENQEADLTTLTMADLTRDLRIGKKFSRHDELLQRHREKQAKYRERLKSKRNDSEDIASENGTPAPAEPAAGDGQGTPAPGVPAPNPASAMPSGPQFQIIDGQIVVDQNSLSLDRHAIAAAAAAGEDMLEIEENDFTTLTTSNSYRTGSKLKGPNVWTEDETELFYRGLQMFGTDFQMISGMFPGKNRRHVKMKFNREERHAPARIDAILTGKKTLAIDLEEYKIHTKAEYESVEDIMAAHRAQQAEFDAKQAKAKAEKDAINAKKKAALMDDGDGEAGDAPNGESSSAGGGGGKQRQKPKANAGPQISIDADGMITIDETDMDPDFGKKKRGTGKAKKKQVEYNMRGEIIS